jgi:quercetin dioxygenase-like cupin family protein
MENQINVLTAVPADKGQLLSVAGGVYRIIISGKETGGAYAAIEMLVPAGSGPNPHAHPDIQESFYVLEGEIEVKTEAHTYTARKGAFINIPFGGLVHCFKNKTGGLAKLLCTVVPSGLEEFFMAVGKPIDSITFLPPPVMDTEGMKRVKSIAEKYGQILYPPDYLDQK